MLPVSLFSFKQCQQIQQLFSIVFRWINSLGLSNITDAFRRSLLFFCKIINAFSRMRPRLAHIKLHPCTVRTETQFVVYISYSAMDGKNMKC